MINQTKHTPSPWILSGKTSALTIGSKQGCRVAQCSKDENYTHEQLANAQLIAAAPELLEALKELWFAVESNCELQDSGLEKYVLNARIAIRKAESE